jgi:hypothetical protein
MLWVMRKIRGEWIRSGRLDDDLVGGGDFDLHARRFEE